MMEIKAPDFPESIADGEVAQWHVTEHEFVLRDQVLVDIETDKVVLEVVAPSDGKVTRIIKTTGDTILSADVLADFESGSKNQPLVETMDVKQAPAGVSAQKPSRASPSARKLASERGLELSDIAGTGKGGMITRDDVVKASPQTVVKETQPVTSTVEASSAEVANSTEGGRIERRVPMTRLRASIARRSADSGYADDVQ